MLDGHSRKVLSDFLLCYCDIADGGYIAKGLLNDKAIKQALKLLDESGIVSLKRVPKEIAKNYATVIPEVRLKDFIEKDKWPRFIDVG